MIIELKPWIVNDAPALCNYANNPKIAARLTDMFPHPYEMKHAEEFIDRISLYNPRQVLAIVVNGEKCGSIGIHPLNDIFRYNAELGYWLAEPFWGKGIMTEAIIMMVKYSFIQFEINRIFARPFGSNLASQKVLEKAGFLLEGKYKQTIYKNNTWEDEYVYAIRR